MAFMIHTADSLAIEYLPCGAICPKAGMALTQTSGNLAIAAGTTKPTYISLYDSPAAIAAGTVIPVLRIDDQMVFETCWSINASTIKLGDKVTLHAFDGLRVTATTNNGVAEVVYIEGTNTGDMCRVRF